MAPGRAKAAAAIAIDIAVEAGRWPPARSLKRRVSRAIDAAVAQAPAAFAPATEVSLVFTDDRHIRALNTRYRGKDAPTNVLSFPAPRSGKEFGPILGDIVLAWETIEREAAEAGLTMDDHLTHLIVHGFLHLLGHEHEEDGAAQTMESLEISILAALDIADPYSDGSAGR